MFNPFRKYLSDIEPTDLAVLRSTSEGWFIEYRPSLPDSSSIAKSVSAFANHHGGWVFLGIEASNNRAGRFVGISLTDLDFAKQTLKEVARHCSQAPHCEVKIVVGPIPDLGLPEGRFIAIVYVPQGCNAPYVHSSGRIYRRMDSSSDPMAETEQIVIDDLWKRRERAITEMERFCSWRPEITTREEGTSYIHLTLMADPFDERGLSSQMGLDRYRRIMADKTAVSGGIPFDNVYLCANGAVARQVINNDPMHQVFTFRYYWNARARVTIPLNRFSAPDGSVGPDYSHMAPFVRELNRQKYVSFTAVDLTGLFSLLASIMKRFVLLLQEDGVEDPDISYSLGLQRVWHRMPFLDSAKFVEYIAEHGVPIVESNDIVIPEEGVIGGLSGPEDVREIFIAAMNAFGISRSLFSKEVLSELIRNTE